MALSNRERVGRILEALKSGLGPFILREYRMTYTSKGYVNEIDLALSTFSYPGLPGVWRVRSLSAVLLP